MNPNKINQQRKDHAIGVSSGANCKPSLFPQLKLYCGDCLDVMTRLTPGSIDMVLADLPYAVTQQKWDSIINPQKLWAAYERVCKPTANLVFTATIEFAITLIQSKPDWFRYDLIWIKNKKTGFLNANRMPLRQHELILVFRKDGQGTYHPQKSTGHAPVHAVSFRDRPVGQAVYGSRRKRTASGGATERHPTSVLSFPVVNNNDPARIHKNQKPVALLEFLIRSYSNPSDTILDSTMGGGSTGVACINTGRDFIGIEKNARFFNLAIKRIKATAKPPR